MSEYRVFVNVTAFASQWVRVTADNEDDAKALVESMIEDNDIDFDWGHYNPGCDRVEKLPEVDDEAEAS